MPINNSYGQTPKRIFTNKPFVKGMYYTNADLEPYVCKAMANIEPEASNTATKLRPGIDLKKLSEDGIALNYLSKIILFKNFVSEEEYKDGCILHTPNADSIKVLNSDASVEYNFYENIINTNNILEFNNGNLVVDNNGLLALSTHKVFALVMNEGDIPHAIFNQGTNTRFNFIGLITDLSNEVVYKGIINIMYHVTANKFIVQLVRPKLLDISESTMYGANIISPNPYILKDWVYWDSNHDYYSEYMGIDSNSNVVSINSVMLFDHQVNANADDYTVQKDYANANIVKGFNANEEGYIYLRPFVTMPNGYYMALVQATVNNRTVSYNFSQATDSTEQPAKDSFEYYDTEDYTSETTHNTAIALKTKQLSQYTTVINSNDYNIACTGKTSVSISNTNNATVHYAKVYDYVLSSFSHHFNTNGYYITDAQKREIFDNGINLHDILSNQYPYLYNKYNLVNNTNINNNILVNLLNKAIHYNDVSDGPLDITVSTRCAEYNIFTLDNINIQNNTITDLNRKLNNKCVSKLFICIRLDCSWDVYDDNTYLEYQFTDVLEVTLDNDSNINTNIALNYKYNNSNDTASINMSITGINDNQPKLIFISDLYNPDHSFMDLLDNQFSSSAVINNYYNNINSYSYSLNIKIYNTKQQCDERYTYILQHNAYRNFSIPLKKFAFKNMNISSLKLTIIRKEGTVETDTTYYIYTDDNDVISRDVDNIIYDKDDIAQSVTYNFRTDINDVLNPEDITFNNDIMNVPVRMCNHLGHTVVWGDDANPNALYYSLFNDDTYFPANYIITFDNPVVYATNYKSNLVVFTTDDVYLLHSGSVPSQAVITTKNEDGSVTSTLDQTETAFVQSVIQTNTRLGKDHINTVRAIGKDLFFITDTNKGYLLKANKYTSDESDVYLKKITSQIDDLLDNPYNYTKDRLTKYGVSVTPEPTAVPFPVYNLKYINDMSSLHNALNSLQTITANAGLVTVIDGDTIEYNNVRYRLADINTAELSTNARLSANAKKYLEFIISDADTVIIYDTSAIDNTTYNRHIAYVETYFQDYDENEQLQYEYRFINELMLINGLATFFDEVHGSSIVHNYNRKLADIARQNNRGLYNSINYSTVNSYNAVTANNISFEDFSAFNSMLSYAAYPTTMHNDLYVYASNSYVYIIQSISLYGANGFTIIYKYNLDSLTWLSYDIPYYFRPYDVVNDANMLGFKLYGSVGFNKLTTKPAILSFNDNKNDTVNYSITFTDGVYYSAIETKLSPINVYFDSGNQSLNNMHEKIFREVKLSLGAIEYDKLSMQSKIDFYVDGKLLIPNQIGKCDKHIHNQPINKHHSIDLNNANDIQKLTYMTACRGRIPRLVFTADCDNDINILEFAIVYLQNNAK